MGLQNKRDSRCDSWDKGSLSRGCEEAKSLIPYFPPPALPAAYLPLDGCWHLIAFLHDAFEHRVAQAWERHGMTRVEGAPRTQLLHLSLCSEMLLSCTKSPNVFACSYTSIARVLL